MDKDALRCVVAAAAIAAAATSAAPPGDAALPSAAGGSPAAAATSAALPDATYDILLHHKGAAGSISRTGDGWKIHYDFSGGGHGVGLKVTPKEPIWPRSVSFDATPDEGHPMGFYLIDSTGQTFLQYAPPDDFGVRKSFTFDVRSGWRYVWGGKGDRVVHFPVRSFAVFVDRITRGEKSPAEVGDIPVWNVTYEPMPEAEMEAEREKEAKCGPAVGVPLAEVRYVVSDFTPGDRFSGAPRAWHLGTDDNKGRALRDGNVEIDFAKNPDVRLVNEVPVWGMPKELILTVEAPAAAAGTELQLGVRFGGKAVFNSLGKLRAPEDGGDTIRQTLSMPAPVNSLGWNKNEEKAKPIGKSKRIVQVRIRKGDAPAERFAFRFVRLEAVTALVPGHEAPLLVGPLGGAVQPVTSDELRVTSEGVGVTSGPPRVIGVEYLNLAPFERVGAEVRVKLTDWQGRDLGEGSAAVPPVASGGRTRVSVALPPVPDGLNFVSCDCSLWQEERPVDEVPGWNVCWTRPPADAGSPELRPDLPWGIGAYLHRTGGLHSFPSAYASPTNAGWEARATQRADMAMAAGFKWERLEFKPSVICPAKGKAGSSLNDALFDFSYTDALLDIAESHGLSCLGIYSHYWPAGVKPWTQEGYDAWIESFRKTAERYKGRIRHWEIWNEPNVGFWNGPKEDYPKLVTAAFRILHEIDPEASIVACSTAGADFGFIGMCREQGMEYDDISYHDYPPDVFEGRFRAELAALAERGHGHPVWMTEIGWPTGCGDKTYTEREQAAKIARAYMTAAASGNLKAIFAYDFVDDGFCASEPENNFGIVRRDMTPKPAYRALAKVCRTFTEGTPSFETVRLDGCTAFVFRMGGKSAVWSDKPVRLMVRTAAPATATNLMDEELSRGLAETEVATGPLAPLFFNANVLSVSLTTNH